ncbi:DUF1007 family protein [Salibaculum sp.]|uniref:DUF1007 family protein n=1 Tax=Salibaculum sp. TaxID=2855480 RepID=UPI002B4AA3A0|nr:DUF1007 family protein [Salibaculum sp.]HKL68520.1 DUF1007 family protein [Salibaculum sp.]
MLRGLTAILAMLTAPAQAHPHLFVDADVALVYEAGTLRAVRLTWTYDEFFSLLLTEDLGLDPDMDGQLTGAERATLSDAVLDWPEGYEGDLYVTQGGRPVQLGARQDASVAFEDGQVIERHTRPVAAAAPGDATVRVYDPGYYTAYTVVTPVTVTGNAACTAQVRRADLIAATEKVDELLYGMPQDEAEVAFPEVGKDFADTIRVSCGG